MKRNANFLMQEVAGKYVVVPVGTAAADFPGMITLNETGVMIWNLLETEQTEEALLQTILDTYDVSSDQAEGDLHRFLDRLSQTGAILR